jgi:hypothetical protein
MMLLVVSPISIDVDTLVFAKTIAPASFSFCSTMPSVILGLIVAHLTDVATCAVKVSDVGTIIEAYRESV